MREPWGECQGQTSPSLLASLVGNFRSMLDRLDQRSAAGTAERIAKGVAAEVRLLGGRVNALMRQIRCPEAEVRQPRGEPYAGRSYERD